jgi:hypothetical protein
MEFARNHPEFGVKPTESSWIHFQRTHAKALIEADVIRRIAYRGRMLADTARFDTATFNLLTTGSVEGRHRPRSVCVAMAREQRDLTDAACQKSFLAAMSGAGLNAQPEADHGQK